MKSYNKITTEAQPLVFSISCRDITNVARIVLIITTSVLGNIGFLKLDEAITQRRLDVKMDDRMPCYVHETSIQLPGNPDRLVTRHSRRTLHTTGIRAESKKYKVNSSTEDIKTRKKSCCVMVISISNISCNLVSDNIEKCSFK